MSRAREEYESILEDFDSKDSDVIIKADNYIQELYKDCKYWESSSDYYKEKYENLEAEKAELIEFIKSLTSELYEWLDNENTWINELDGYNGKDLCLSVVFKILNLLKKHGVEI